MDDSDEYFDDTLVIDDAVLASIQAVEEQFVAASASQAQSSRRSPNLSARASDSSIKPPPSKRLKVSHDYHSPQTPIASAPAVRHHPLSRMESMDMKLDQLDIRCGPDGSYIMGTPQTSSSSSTTNPNPGQPIVPKRNLVRRANRVATSPTESMEDARPPTASQKRTILIKRALAEVSTIDSPMASTERKVVQKPPPSTPQPDLQEEMATLRAQLTELVAANAAIQQALKEAQDAQFVKAGEVAILRQAIDRTKKEHAETVAKARADMLAHEKIKAELQAKLKSETERLATRLVFKQHEMETSTRKPAWGSVRARRIKEIPPPSSFAETPLRPSGSQIANSSKRILRRTAPEGGKAPENREDMEAPLSSPTTHDRRARPPADSKKPGFKGFHNAFTDTQPVGSSPTKRARDNKGSHRASDPFGETIQGNGVNYSDMTTPKVDKGKGREVYNDTPHWDKAVSQSRLEGSPENAPMEIDDNMEFSPQVGYKSEEQDLLEDGSEEEEMAEDLGEELRRIMFTHVAPENDMLTLQILFSTDLSSTENPRDKEVYVTACRVILDTCGTRLDHLRDLQSVLREQEIVHKVSDVIVTIITILARNSSTHALSAILDLSAVLCLYLPVFAESWVAALVYESPLQEQSTRPLPIFPVLVDIVLRRLPPPKTENAGSSSKEDCRQLLVARLVHFLEAICWNVDDVFVRSFAELCQQDVLAVLLDPLQPPLIIVRVLRLLLLLSSYEGTFQFLVYPESNGQGTDSLSRTGDGSRIPLIDKLCHFLVNETEELSSEVQRLVICIISVLCDSRSEGRGILLEPLYLGPSIVVAITRLSRSIWEEEIPSDESPNVVRSSLELVYMSVYLLHKLVFHVGLAPILGRKLVEASHLSGPFNGITHMFIVTFGRLSWAPTPGWLDDNSKALCENIVELAIEIIETVVTGPECDSLWIVWHENEVVDDEEDEARKIMID